MSRIRNNLDLAWKEALSRWLPEFLALFQPEVHAAIDWTRPPVFLDSETRRLRRPPRGRPWTLRGQRRVVDMVARVALRQGAEALVLTHVEVQGRHDPDLPLRMRLYNDRLFDLTALPVFSMAVLIDASPTWRPDRHVVELWGCRSTLEFPVVKLLDWRDRREELERSGNPFSLVVAANLTVLETKPDQPARLEKALKIVRLLLQRGFTQEQIDGLFDILEVMMPMNDKLSEIFTREVTLLEKQHARRLVTPTEIRALKKGRQEGRVEAQCAAIRTVLEARFGEVPEHLEAALPTGQDLDALVRHAATAANLEEFLALLP